MFQFDIKKALTPNLGKIQGTIAGDLKSSVDTAMGLEGEWHDVKLFEMMETALIKSMNRISVGEPLCHEKGYLDSLSLLVRATVACVL